MSFCVYSETPVCNPNRMKTPMFRTRAAFWQVSLASVACLAASSHLRAQSETTPPAADPAPEKREEEVVKLSVFEVKDTAETGYGGKESATGLKTGVPLMDLPMVVTVIPRAMIEDIGEKRFGIGETLQFKAAGVVRHGDLDAIFIRGIRGPNALLDGSYDGNAYHDLATIDSIDLLRGPSAVTYPTTDLGGVIIKNTKKPLPVSRQMLSATVGPGGFYRGEFDSTGPLYKQGNARLTYRVVGAAQKSDGWTKPIDRNDRYVIAPSLQYDVGNVTLRLAADYDQINVINYAGTFLKKGPDGRTTGPWDGYGKYGSMRAPWEDHPYSDNHVRATALVRLSEGWEMKLFGTYTGSYTYYKQPRFLVTPDQVAGTVPMWTFQNDESDKAFFGEFGVNGKYHALGMDHVSTFGGYALDRQSSSIRYQYAGPTMSLYNPDFSIFPDPTNNPAAIAARTYLGTPNRGYSTLLNAYYMHTANLFSDRVILVGGVSWVESRSKTYQIATKLWDNPPNANDTPYRLGVVVKPIKGISLFANKSTTFAFQGNRTVTGALVGVRQGEVVEYGVKGDLFDGKLSFQVDRYDLQQTNLAVIDPNFITAYIGSGKFQDRGWEFEAQYQPTSNWLMMFSMYSGDVRNLPANTKFNDSLDHSASALTKYTFSKDSGLGGLSVGADWIYIGQRWWPAANGGGFPPTDVFGAFVSYEREKWKVSVSIKNLTDKYYAMGGFDPLQWAWTGEPRAFYLTIRREF